MNRIHKQTLSEFVEKLNPNFRTVGVLKPALVAELNRLLAELNYNGRKTEVDLEVFVSQQVANRRNRAKPIPPPEAPVEDVPVKPLEKIETEEEDEIQIEERFVRKSPEEREALRAREAVYYTPNGGLELFEEMLAEYEKKRIAELLEEEERQKRKIHEETLRKIKLLKEIKDLKHQSDINEILFVRSSYEEENARRKFFNDRIREQIDATKNVNKKKKLRELMREYMIPEMEVSDIYSKDLIDEINMKKADELIAQFQDKELADLTQEDIECLLLIEPQLIEDFKRKLAQARGRFSTRFYDTDNISKSGEESSVFKKSDPIRYYFDN
jgi:hypothetical protein